MENASNALLMGAEILIGVLILSILAGLYFAFDGYMEEIQNGQEMKKIYEINSKFQEYVSSDEINPNILSAHDVLTIHNLIEEYNKQFEDENGNLTETGRGEIQLEYSNMPNVSHWDYRFIEENAGNKYKIQLEYYGKDEPLTGCVKKVKIFKV